MRRCEGFVVETPTRRIGRGDGIRYGLSQDEPEALAVRAGRFGRRLLLVCVEGIDRVDAVERRVILTPSAALGMSFCVRASAGSSRIFSSRCRLLREAAERASYSSSVFVAMTKSL